MDTSSSNYNLRDDPVLSMNNLHLISFSDFMILHKIFPKIFMLSMDNKQTISKVSSKNKLDGLERQKTMMKNQEQITLKKALTRRSEFLRQRSLINQPSMKYNSFAD